MTNPVTTASAAHRLAQVENYLSGRNLAVSHSHGRDDSLTILTARHDSLPSFASRIRRTTLSYR